MILLIYKKVERLVREKFADIVLETKIIYSSSGRARKLRITLFNTTYIDIWYSKTGEYSYHWEQRPLRNLIYRHDNAPHKKWNHIKTFPKHFHNRSEQKAIESRINNNPLKAIKEFMNFIRENM